MTEKSLSRQNHRVQSIVTEIFYRDRPLSHRAHARVLSLTQVLLAECAGPCSVGQGRCCRELKALGRESKAI